MFGPIFEPITAFPKTNLRIDQRIAESKATQPINAVELSDSEIRMGSEKPIFRFLEII